MSDNTVPNLDCMSSKELMDFWKEYHEGGTLLDEEGMEIPAGAVATLSCYAVNKACAQDLRLQGEIERAQKYEQACEIHYEDLPESARW